MALAPQIEGIENVAFNDFTIGVDTTGVTQANNTWQWSDNFSKVTGKHMLKFGAGIHHDQVNINPDATYNGSFLFQGTETGSDFADFLLGIASSYAQADSRSFYLRNKYVGLYAPGQLAGAAQPDDQLRLALGFAAAMAREVQPDADARPGAAVGGLSRRAGGPGFSQATRGFPTLWRPAEYTNFAPRIGVAYSPATKTSVRAGYGLFYTAFEGLSAGIMSANPPYGYDYHQPRSASVRHAVRHRGQRAGRGTAVSGTHSRVRQPRRRIRTRRSTGPSTCRSPACRRSSTET